jgi:hypothetical protein
MDKYDRDPWRDAETVPAWLIVVIVLLFCSLAFGDDVRLPRPRDPRDAAIWGALINQFLRVSHNENGTLKATALDGLLAETEYAANGYFGIDEPNPVTLLDVNGVISAINGDSYEWDIAFNWGDHSTGGYLKADGSVALAGPWDMGNQLLTNVNVTNVGLSNVTITSGTITGITDLAVADGGTGASSAGDARINLGLVIGTNIQAYDADLDDLSDGTLSKSKLEDSGNWDTAYGWGDHGTQNYLDDDTADDVDDKDIEWGTGADQVSASDMPNEDIGDITISDGVYTLDNDVIGAGEIGDGDYGDFTFTSGIAAIDADSVALTTDTTGNYAAGDAEAGSATSGDSATAFFDSGTLEHERGGLEADVSAYSGLVAIAGGATAEIDDLSELEGQIADVTAFVVEGTACSDIEGDHLSITAGTLNVGDDWYDAVGDIPSATPSDGDTTHLSTADEIYDWVIGLGYVSATLTEEEVEDYVGGMLGGTETLITVTYQDATDDIDYVVDNDLHNYDWSNVVDADITNTLTSSSCTGNAATATALAANGANAAAGEAILGVDASGAAEGAFDVWTEAENTAAGYISATLTEEEVEDFVGGMLGGTETHIAVTYQDATGDIDFVVSPSGVAGAIAAGELADDSVQNADIDWADIDNLGDEGAITVADTADATCFVALWESATGDLAAKSDAALIYDASTGTLGATIGTFSNFTLGGAGASAYTILSSSHVILQTTGDSDILFKAGDIIAFQPDGESDDYSYWAAAGGHLYLDTADSADLHIKGDADLYLQPDNSVIIDAPAGDVTISASDDVILSPTDDVSMIPGGDVVLNPTGDVQIPDDWLAVGLAAPLNPVHIFGVQGENYAILQLESDSTGSNQHCYITLYQDETTKNVGTLIYGGETSPSSGVPVLKWYGPDYVNENYLRYHGPAGAMLHLYDSGEVWLPQVYGNDIGTERDLLINSDGELGYDSSSRKYKINIEDLNDTDYARILQLRPIRYDRKDGKQTNQLGFTAERMAEIFPELVSYKREPITGMDYSLVEPAVGVIGYQLAVDPNGNKIPESVNYKKVGVLAIEAIQRQQVLIDELRTEVDILKADVAELKVKAGIVTGGFSKPSSVAFLAIGGLMMLYLFIKRRKKAV